jgi:hypothetical protein
MIEYLAPSSGGGISQLKYTTINLAGSDFTKLSTQPITLIPANGQKLIPFNVTVKYNNIGTMLVPLLIGFEALLAANVTSCSWGLTTLLTGGEKGIYSQSFVFADGALENINNQDLILWQSIDNTSLDFSTFIVNILYLEVSNL